MRASVRGVLVLVLLAVASACGSDSSIRHRDGGIDQIKCEPGSPFDLNGRFGVLAIFNTQVQVLGLELEDPNPQAQILLLADIAQTGTDATLTATVCDIKIPEVQLKGQPNPIIFKPGPNLLASVPPVPAASSLSGTTTCASFGNAAPLAVLLGAKLVDPINDFLPADPTTQGCGGDPTTPCATAAATADCICDQELDHKMGATLLIENAPVIPDLDQVYVTLRTTIVLDGQVFSSDLIQGEVTPTLEQTILDCHRLSGPCDSTAAGAIRKISPTIEQDPRYPSTFAAKRIDSSWDCLRLTSEKDTLFPP